MALPCRIKGGTERLARRGGKMRDWADVGLLLVCTLACGRGVPSPSSSVGSVGGRSDSFTLTIDIAGQGTVTAAAQSLRCASTCAEQLAAGTAVYLDAQPAQGMQFMDWSGACTGAADC